MVNINIKFEKRHLVVLGVFLVLLIGGFVIAYNPGGAANPAVFGHSANEVEGTLKTFVGTTPQAYNGLEVGGYSGGDAKCNAAYPGSRMCYTGDFVNGRPPQIGWYNSYIASVSYDIATGFINYYTDCNGWTRGDSQYLFGPSWSFGSPLFNACNSRMVIACCR